MHGSEEKDGLHSTPEEDPRPKLMPRVFGSLAILGLMVGLMIGGWNAPHRALLEQVETVPHGLVLWFDAEPQVRQQTLEGAMVLSIQAEGGVQGGQLQVNGKPVNWRIQRRDQELLLSLVAARALQGEWAAEPVDGRWKLTVQVRGE